MKKKILSLALLAALFATGCGNTSESNTANPDTTAKPTETATQPAETTTEEPLPETMNITGAKLVSVSETVTLTANVTNATWTSSDETVATVAGGVVTGVKAGTATITASYSTLSATFEVTVLDNIGSTLNQADGTEVHVKGQVAAADSQGFVLTDIHNYVYVYAKNNELEDGDYIDFQGKVAFDSTKNYVYELKPNQKSEQVNGQWTNTITGITELTEGDYETIVPTYEATAYDEASLNAMTYAQGAVYATMIGEVKSGYVYLGETKIKISNTKLDDGYYNITSYLYKNNNAYYLYLISSSAEQRPAATALTITNDDNLTINIGSSGVQLEVKQTPAGAADELQWTVSNSEIAAVSETGFVTLTDLAKDKDTFTVTVTSKVNATLTDSVSFTVAAPLSGEQTVKLAYTGTSTTNMDGTNQAELLGADPTFLSIVGEKTGNNNVGLNKDGTIRLYSNGSCTLTIAGATENVTVTSLAFEFGSKSTGTLVVKNSADASITADESGSYKINDTKAVLSDSHEKNQVHFTSITVVYNIA